MITSILNSKIYFYYYFHKKFVRITFISNLIIRPYKQDLLAWILDIKTMSPNSTQKELAKEPGFSTSRLQRYRQDIIRLSHYRIPKNSHEKNKKKFEASA